MFRLFSLLFSLFFSQTIPNTAFPLDVIADSTNPTYNIADSTTTNSTYNNTNNTNTNNTNTNTSNTNTNNVSAYPNYAPTYASVVLPNNTILNNNQIIQNQRNNTNNTTNTTPDTTYTTNNSVPLPMPSATTFSREGAMENFLGSTEARAVVGAAEPYLLLFTNQVCPFYVL